jgi:hypothetical protein
MFDAAVKGCDVVLGSRFSRESVLINYPLRKILFNRTFHLLASLLFRQRLRDVTNNLSCSVVRWCRIWIWSCPGLEPMQKLDSSRCLWGIECTPSPSPGSIVPQTWGNQAFRFLEPAGNMPRFSFRLHGGPAVDSARWPDHHGRSDQLRIPQCLGVSLH